MKILTIAALSLMFATPVFAETIVGTPVASYEAHVNVDEPTNPVAPTSSRVRHGSSGSVANDSAVTLALLQQIQALQEQVIALQHKILGM